MVSGKWNLPARSPSPRSPHGPNPTVPMVNRRGGWPPRPPVLTSPCTYREGRGVGAGKIFHPKSCFGWKIRGSSSAHILFAPCSPLYRNPPPSFSVARFTYFTFLVPAHPCSRPPEVASGEGAEGRPRPDVASARTSFIIPFAPPLPRASWESQPPFQPFRAFLGGSQKSVAFQLF